MKKIELSKVHTKEDAQLQLTRHLWCMVSPPIIVTKCTDGKHGNYDLTSNLIININVGLSDNSKKWRWEIWLSCIDCKYLANSTWATITVGVTAE